MIEKPDIDVRDKGFKNRITLKRAFDIAFENISPLGIEEINFREMIPNRLKILAEDVKAKYSVPNFDRATMDGYAIRSKDTSTASETNEISLELIEEIFIKQLATKSIEKGQAIKIPTGGVVPKGADCIIKLENTKLETIGSKRFIIIKKSIDVSKNISKKGEDFKENDLIFKKGKFLSSVDIGVLLSVGISSVKCLKVPKIGILATGDEIVDGERDLLPGEVYESNSYVLVEYLNKIGIPAKRYKMTVDDFNSIKQKIQDIIESNDIIITSGGTSVGKKDFVPIVLNDLSNVLVHGISIRPGSPTTFSVKNNKYFIGLPGFPVSNLISFMFFGLPIVLHTMGATNISFFKLKAILTEDYKSIKGRTDFLRVSLTNNIDSVLATPITVVGSSLLRTLSTSDGIVILDDCTERISKNEIVTVLITDKLINNNSC